MTIAITMSIPLADAKPAFTKPPIDGTSAQVPMRKLNITQLADEFALSTDTTLTF
jgi:hypothetical protein